MWSKANGAKKLLWFTQQLYLLSKAGIDFATSLTILKNSTDDKVFGLQIAGIIEVIKQGQSLSEGLKNYPQLFDQFYVEMVAMGEKTGKLIEILPELQRFCELKHQLRSDIFQALTYPCFILIVMLVITIGLCFSVIPQFDAIFKSLNAPLPLMTRALFASVTFIQAHALLVFMISGAGGWLIFKIFQKTIIYFKKTTHLFRVPLFGSFYQAYLLTWFFKVLGLSLKAGFSMQDAILLLQKIFRSTPLSLLIQLIEYDLQKGESLKVIFDHKKYLPLFCQSLISVAEQTGNLDERFMEISTIFQQRIEAKVRDFKALLEPVMMLCMGLVVGGLVLAIYYPIFSMGQLM